MGVTAGMASRALGVSTTTLSSWADKGRIKVTRSAGGWRLYDAADVERLKKRLEKRDA